MQKYNGALLRKFDDPVQGNASVGTSVVVRKKSDNSIAPIYSVDDINSIQKPNPFTTDAFGRYSFFAPNGKYILQFGDGSDEIEISMADNLDHNELLNRNAGGAHDATAIELSGGESLEYLINNPSSLISSQNWIDGETVNVGEYRSYNGKIWEPNQNGTICQASPSFIDFHLVTNDGLLWPDQFGASYIAGVDQSPYINKMEAFGLLTNRATNYKPVIHYLLTPIILNREPNMIGSGGGQGSIRNRKLNPDRRYTGTVFYSQVAGDYALKIDLSSFHFGGRIENITLVGRLDHVQQRTIGNGAIFNGWGWSAQVNNLSIEGFQGKNLTIGYMQDTVFNSLTLLDGSNGAQNPMLEFTAESNFIYFNNPHIEEFEYAIRVKDGTNSPWEIKFINGHFEAGNYTNGSASSAPDPSAERRYTSPPIYSSSFVRDWTFDNCFFVPVSSRALAADSDGLIDNKPYFIRFEDSEGVAFTGKTRFQAQGACDAIFLGSSGTINEFGRNTIQDLTVVNANPTKYSVDVNNTNVENIQILFDPITTNRLYGIAGSNGAIKSSKFNLKNSLSARNDGYLIFSGSNYTLGVGDFEYSLSTSANNFASKSCYLLHNGARSVISPVNGTTGVIDMQKIPHDCQIIFNSSSPTTVSDVINCCAGKKVILSNRGSGAVTINATSNIKPSGGSSTFGQDVAIQFYCDDTVLRQI